MYQLHRNNICELSRITNKKTPDKKKKKHAVLLWSEDNYDPPNWLTRILRRVLVKAGFRYALDLSRDTRLDAPEFLVSLLEPQRVDGHVEHDAELNETTDEADLPVVDFHKTRRLVLDHRVP